MMMQQNSTAWTERETNQDALHSTLLLLNRFIEIHQHQGHIPGPVAESLFAGVESALAHSAALGTAMNNPRTAVAAEGDVSK